MNTNDQLHREWDELRSKADEAWRCDFLEETGRLLAAALAAAEKFGPADTRLAESLFSMAKFYDSSDFAAKALPLFLRAHGIYRGALGPRHAKTTDVLGFVAVGVMAKAKFAGPEQYVKTVGELLGPQHLAAAPTLDQVAYFLLRDEKYAEAGAVLKHALELRENTLGSGDAEVAENLYSLVQLYRMQNRHAEADGLHQRALNIWENTLGAASPEFAAKLEEFCDSLAGRGNFSQAEKRLVRVARIQEKAYGANDPRLAQTLGKLVRFYHQQKLFFKAEEYCQRVIVIWEKTAGAEPYLIAGLATYADLLREMKREAEADEVEARVEALRGPRDQAVRSLRDS